jgi:hypothetical protein
MTRSPRRAYDDPERPHLDLEDDSAIIPPPNSFTVHHQHKPILYLLDGRVLVRRPVGFDTTRDTE